MLAASLSKLANFSLTSSTWSSYRTAAGMLQTCCNSLNIPLAYPVSQQIILSFIAWLDTRGISASTISSYLSAVRQVHLSLGLPIPTIRSDLVQQVLSGKKKLDATTPNLRPIRIPVTPAILRLLKIKISGDGKLSPADKLTYWLLCSLAFHGCFRMGELISRSPSSFDPRFTLLRSDVDLRRTLIKNTNFSFLEVTLRSTKTATTATTIIDIFQTNTNICPVKAYTRWCTISAPNQSTAAFQLSSGKLITASNFNANLRRWLGESIDFSRTTVSGHSFRAGLPSVLGTLGFDDKDLKEVGRWSSRAFLLYSKLPRTKRLAMAKALGDLNV